MEFPDLYKFPKNSPPSPYGKPLLVVRVGRGVLPKGVTLRTIGWLEHQGYPTGEVGKEIVDKLFAALSQGRFNDGSRGVHSCTLCGNSLFKIRWRRRQIEMSGHGHYLLQCGKVVYMAPAMLLHYIVDHHYCPPEEFLDAVVNGRFLTVDDLDVTWNNWGD